MRHIVILVFDRFQLLDATGPASVFGAARDEADGYEIVIASAGGGEVKSSCGVALTTTPVRWIKPAAVDLLLVVGGDQPGLRDTARDAALKEWFEKAASSAERFGSVCTGAFILAAWGLLDGKRAATHWMGTAELAKRYPAVSVDPEALYVEDGRVWTSAGITTGIDMALAIVERDHGAAIAASVARRLVLYQRRPGHQSQFSALLDAQGKAGSYATLVDWIAANLDKSLDVETLAARAGQSPRNFHRGFTAATGKTPAAFVESLRLDRARTLLSSGAPLKRVAAECGFASPERLTKAFTRVFGVAPATWRAMHARAA